MNLKKFKIKKKKFNIKFLHIQVLALLYVYMDYKNNLYIMIKYKNRF